jgi:hypothetical protein
MVVNQQYRVDTPVNLGVLCPLARSDLQRKTRRMTLDRGSAYSTNSLPCAKTSSETTKTSSEDRFANRRT